MHWICLTKEELDDLIFILNYLATIKEETPETKALVKKLEWIRDHEK